MGINWRTQRKIAFLALAVPFSYAAGVAAGLAVGAGVAERSGSASYTDSGSRDLLTSRCEIFAASHSASIRT